MHLKILSTKNFCHWTIPWNCTIKHLLMAHGSIVAPKKMGDGMIEAYSYIRNMPIQDVYNVFDGVSQGEKDSRYQDSKSQKERIEQGR